MPLRPLPLLAAVAIGLTASPVLAADPVEGVWQAAGGDAKVRIAPCAAQSERLCGTIVWVRDENGAASPGRDVNNPDPKLRGRSILGLQLIRDFQRAEPGRWTDGKIYDPQSGRTYASNMRLNADGTLKVEGCVVLLCLGQTWRRAG